MNGSERPRRRLTPQGPRRFRRRQTDPWLITIAAAAIVVVAGWFLGQALARVLGTRDDTTTTTASISTQSAAPIASPTAAPPTTSPTPEPTVLRVVKPAPKFTHNPAKARRSAPPAPSPTPAPSAAPTTAPTATATVVPTAVPTGAPTPPVRAPRPTTAPRTPAPRTPAPRTPAPRTPTPRTPAPPAAQSSAGEATVRAYIDSLRRGDPQTAASYLGNGAPDEGFIDQDTRIASISSSVQSDGSYRVRVTMQTARGTYEETFVVSGGRILDKTAVKP